MESIKNNDLGLLATQISNDYLYSNSLLSQFSDSELISQITESHNNVTETRIVFRNKLNVNDSVYFYNISFNHLISDDFNHISELVIYCELSDVDDGYVIIKELNKDIQELINSFDEFILDGSSDGSSDGKLYRISFDGNDLVNIPISINYNINRYDILLNKDTKNDIDKMIESLDNKGLNIIYGDNGMGKTSIIRYISDNVDRDIVFIPYNAINYTINSPLFYKYLVTYDPILVLDDCDDYMYNDITSNDIIINIRQLVSNLGGLNTNIICIFNGMYEDIFDGIASNIIEFKDITNKQAKKLNKLVNGDNKLDFSLEYKISDIINQSTKVVYNSITNDNKMSL